MKNNRHTLAKVAMEVVEKEAEALKKLPGSINDDFLDVVELIGECNGRLVVSGVGKSAIIAAKIVATLNSTGTKAVFMHAADAAHGDLGMVDRDDVVMLISKSGNSQEIKNILPLLKNMGVKVVGMVSNMNSSLAKGCDYLLYAPVDGEACPNNLAPTVSTTVHLALGDALAMTLSYMKGFSSDDFARVHPGGALGKRLYMRVRDVFDQDNVPWVEKSESIQRTIINISSHRLGATVVLSPEKRLMGIITDGDVRRMIEKGVDMVSACADSIMNPNPKTISIDALAVDAFALMEKYKITSVVVMDGDEYKGLVHIHDLIREGIL